MNLIRHSATSRVTTGRANMVASPLKLVEPECQNTSAHFFIPPAPTQPCKAGAAQSRRNHTEGNEHEDSIRRGTITTKTVTKGGDRERSDCYDLFDWVKDRCRHVRSEPSPLNGSEPVPARNGRGVGKARWQEYRRCEKCKRREVYQPKIKTMNWCEPCIWNFVREDCVLG